MKRVYELLAAIVVSVLVTLTYYYFEAVVRHSINYIWDDLFKTGNHRILVVPIAIVLGFAFFGIQHFLDPESEKAESHGLGSTPKPTIINYVRVLLIGFASLVAGASLGPEAILVPACMVIGGYVAVKLFKKDEPSYNFLSVGAFSSLLAAFFNSFLAGLLGMLLITKTLKIKLDSALVLSAVVASGITVLILKQLESSAYTTLPSSNTKITVAGVLIIPVLFVGGYLVTYVFGYIHDMLENVRSRLAKLSWWIHGVIATTVLSVLYLLGGTLVEFTGNESVVPMLQKSAKLGAIGLIWILVIKLLAMGWSKATGYRGGLVFPSILLASILVAIVQLYIKDTNFTVCLIAVMVGLIAADTKVKVLF